MRQTGASGAEQGGKKAAPWIGATGGTRTTDAPDWNSRGRARRQEGSSLDPNVQGKKASSPGTASSGAQRQGGGPLRETNRGTAGRRPRLDTRCGNNTRSSPPPDRNFRGQTDRRLGLLDHVGPIASGRKSTALRNGACELIKKGERSTHQTKDRVIRGQAPGLVQLERNSRRIMGTVTQAPGLQRLQRPMAGRPVLAADHQQAKRHNPQDWNVQGKKPKSPRLDRPGQESDHGPREERERGPETGPAGVGKPKREREQKSREKMRGEGRTGQRKKSKARRWGPPEEHRSGEAPR